MPTQNIEAQEYKALQGQVAVDEAQGIIEAFVAGIGNKDSVGDICLPGCFNASLKRRKPRVVWGHSWNDPIGKVLEIYEVPASDPRLPAKMKAAGIGGLYARVQFNLKSERGREAFADVSFFGEEQEWSIGYKTLQADFDPKRQANMLKELELYEVSPVLHGANQLTATISIKSDEIKATAPPVAPKKTVGQTAGTVGQQTGAPGATAQGTQDTTDHDGDGMIFDGTPNEQRVPYKRQSAAGGKYEQERRRYVRGELRRQGIKPNRRVEDRSKEERDARARARAAFDKQTVQRGAEAQAQIGRANTEATRAQRLQAQSDRLTAQAQRSSAVDRKPADRIDNSPPARRIDAAERMRQARGTNTGNSTGGDQPVRAGVGTRPDRQSTGGDQPVRAGVGQVGRPVPSTGGDQPVRAGVGQRDTRPSGADDRQRPDSIDRGRPSSTVDRSGGVVQALENPSRPSTSGAGSRVRALENPKRPIGPPQPPRKPKATDILLYNQGKSAKWERGEDGGVPARNPMGGRKENLPIALAMNFGGAVRIREADENMVVFDHKAKDGTMHTLRVSYHFDGDEFMFGNAVKVKPQMVYIAQQSDNLPTERDGDNPYEEQYNMETDPQVPQGVEPKVGLEKADPLGGILPQELVTGDILKGRGPRRGNLEQLLRYWRPIMKREGGFRRCRVILANHPELYPLSNICAWLHHETTGLWPNEGCHHPGMKNCRKKLKRGTDGSLWSDSQWNERLSRLGKSGEITLDEVASLISNLNDDEMNFKAMEELANRLAGVKPPVMGEMQPLPGDKVPAPKIEMQELPDFETDDEEKGNEMATMALRMFMNQEPDFINHMNDNANWVVVGEDEDGNESENPYNPSEGKDSDEDDCGCGGDGNSQQNLMRMIQAVMSQMGGKDLSDEEIEEKAGRVISTRNMAKLRQALGMLQEVVSSGGMDAEVKSEEYQDDSFLVESDDVFTTKSLLDPVLEYYGIDAEATDHGVEIKNLSMIEDDAFEALFEAVASLDTI